MTEENNANNDSKKANSRQNEVAPSYLRWVFIGGGIALLGLLLTSIYWPNLTERTKFFTGNLLNLVIGLAVIAQVLIYRKQWGAMAQGLAIERAKTDPRLRVAEVRIENFEVGKRPAFIVTIANDGLIAATGVKIHIGVKIGTGQELDWINDPVITIPARGRESYPIVSGSELVQKHIDGFNLTVPLKVEVRFNYWPVGTKEFCYKYLPWDGQRPDDIPQFVPCDFEPRLNTSVRLTGVQAKAEIGTVGVVIQEAASKAQPQEAKAESKDDKQNPA